MINSKSKKIFFFGSFAFFSEGNTAYAASGSQVQLEIIRSIKSVFSKSTLYSYIYEPNKTWPFSRIYFGRKKIADFQFHSYLNIKGIREIVILIKRIAIVVFNKPDLVFLYNISFVEAFAYSLCKRIFNFKVVLFIQDVNENTSLDKFCNFLTYRIVSYFDLLIPITSSIIEDFNLPVQKSILFQGGCTEIAFKMQDSCVNSSVKLLPKAVFAGKLEKYNGIDKLVDYWITHSIALELHIYGSGSFESELLSKLSLNPSIKYFGLVSDIEVFTSQLNSAINFCLRYSIDINQNYFFPSKLFNVLSAPGITIVNRFSHLSESMQKHCYVVDDDLTNLKGFLDSSGVHDVQEYNDRITWLNSFASWNELMVRIEEHLK